MSLSDYPVFNSFSRVVVILFLGLALNCWKHQDHEITAPATPVFTLSGHISDADSRQVLPGIEIQCVPAELLFDWQLVEPVTVTDSTGYYAFELCPGNYTLQFYRAGFPVGDKKLVIGYHPRVIDYSLPKVAWTTRRYAAPGTLGIAWVNAGKAILAGTALLDSVRCYRIFTGNFSMGFQPVGTRLFAKENPAFYGITWINGTYRSIGGSLSRPKIFQVDESSGQVVAEFPAPHRLWDLTTDGNNLWATASNDSIYQLDPSGKRMRAFGSPRSQTGGIAWNGTHLWISATDGEKRLYRLAPSGVADQTWRLFYLDETGVVYTLDALPYLAFAPDSSLWVVDREWVYRFPEF